MLLHPSYMFSQLETDSISENPLLLPLKPSHFYLKLTAPYFRTSHEYFHGRLGTVDQQYLKYFRSQLLEGVKKKGKEYQLDLRIWDLRDP